MADLLALEGVHKSFPRGDRRLRVLEDVSLQVRDGEIVAVVGMRAEGKTTLLEVAAGIQRPDDGRVSFEGLDLARLGDRERSRLLGREIAWIHRGGAGPRLEVRDYVGLALRMGRRRGRREARRQAVEALERVGVADCARQRWTDLSDWERVMVGFARGIAREPRLMVVDDLIDGLGILSTREAGELLRSLVDELGCGVLMSASDLERALFADRVWSLERGRLRLMYDLTRPANIIDFPNDARRNSAG